MILVRQDTRAIAFTWPVIFEKLQAMWADVLILVLLTGVACLASFHGSSRLDPVVFGYDAIDLWMDADIPRVVKTMTDRFSLVLHRKHPLFPTISYPPVYLIKNLLGTEPLTAVRIVIAGVASVWSGTLFFLLRVIGCRRFDAVLFTLLGMCTASAMFWFVVPESFSFGSVTILWAMALVAFAEHRPVSSTWYVAVSVLTLSATVTNWMAGIIATIVNHPWKRSIQLTVNALVVVTLIWVVQKLVFPSVEFFLPPNTRPEYVLSTLSSGSLNVLKVFFLDSIIMPAIDVTYWPAIFSYLPVMTVQDSLPGSGTNGGFWGVLAWGLLLGLGLWALLFLKQQFRFRIALGLTLLGQLVLHMLFGWETFLFSIHFVPLLVVIAALSTLTRARVVALSLAGAVTVFAGINNFIQFGRATEFVRSRVTESYLVDVAKSSRQTDPFPRNAGHVVLSTPGSREIDKAYHEPGGSFSPSVGSFGVSIWVTDKQGEILVFSDTIPLENVSQKFDWSGQTEIPAIVTETAYYRMLWSSMGPGRWKLNLKVPSTSSMKAVLMVRSVGPAGGPIRSLDWDGRRLLINDRWSMTSKFAPLDVQVGHEGDKDWKIVRTGTTAWKGDDGWGYARITLPSGKEWEAVIEDTAPIAVAPLMYATPRSALELELPDARFTASLKAQVAHLMMGLVGKEARPGDPMAFPFPWLREEAYTIAALARAGQLGPAKELSKHLAENDFFGGFGPTADAPGLAIWALTEVAMQLKQPEFDRWVWPHINRKANFIVPMLSPDRPTDIPVSGPIVPTRKKDPELSLVSDPSRDGLIVGKKDTQRSFMYVNAVNYRGLLSAADLAERINRFEEALRYRAVATGMKNAWVRAAAAQTSNSGQPDPVRRMPTWLADAQTSVFFKSQLNGPNKARRRPQFSHVQQLFRSCRGAPPAFCGSGRSSLGSTRTFLEWTGIPRPLHLG